MAYKYFSDYDFCNASPRCSIDSMSPAFLSRLDQAREIAGVPFVINSAFRSIEYEKSKGRAGTSAHCFGKAVDIRARNSKTRLAILRGLLAVGFSRIGIGDTFIHVDCDDSKSQDVLFTYYK